MNKRKPACGRRIGQPDAGRGKVQKFPYIKRGWVEPPIVWAAIIGESGCGKTPGFRCAFKAIKARQHRLILAHEEALREYEARIEEHGIEIKKWERAARDADTPPERPVEPAKPTCPRAWIEDSTTEALAGLLLENPRGLLCIRNELSGWFAFGQYKNGGGGDDVARWLQMWDNEPIMIDRKGSGYTYVPLAAVSVAGGIQPAILDRALGQQHRENGLLARMLLSYPPRCPKRWTDAEIPDSIESRLYEAFEYLYGLQLACDDDGAPQPKLVPLNRGAKALFARFVNEHGAQQALHTGHAAAAFSKLEAYVPRLALVFHLVRVGMGDTSIEDPNRIDRASIDAAIRIVRWCLGETLRVYALFEEDEESRLIRQHVDMIAKVGGSVTVREWSRHRSIRSSEAEAELHQLAEAGRGMFVHDAPKPKGGRPSKRFVLHLSLASDNTSAPPSANAVPAA